jgi:hypothetical protein
MSYSRISYDTCTYSQKLNENVSQIGYVLDPLKYKHCSPCRFELGLVGGNNVSNISGNIVDLESNLFGIDREASKCSALKYLPGEYKSKGIFKTTCHKAIDTTPQHLNKCQMFSYPAVQAPPPMNLYKCP